MKHLKPYRLFELHSDTIDSYYNKKAFELTKQYPNYNYQNEYDIDFDIQKIFIMASEKGHTEIVRLLLNDERVDPSDDNNWAVT